MTHIHGLGGGMGYKGAIAAGSAVKVTLRLGATEGPATLFASFARSGGGGSVEDSALVSPGHEGHAELLADAKGLLGIAVDMSHDTEDPGTLHVFVDGEPRTPDPVEIRGDTKWTYAVEATS